MVTVLAAADVVNAVGMCDVFVTEAACRIDDTPISNPLHCSRNTTGTYRLYSSYSNSCFIRCRPH